MKKSSLIIGIICIMLVGLTSCNWFKENTNVRFYDDGQEITADSITVLQNTRLELAIKATNDGADWHILWLMPNGYPVELQDGDGHLRWITDSQMNNRVLSMVFEMFLADSLYQHGDVCHLRCKSDDYIRDLSIVVE